MKYCLRTAVLAAALFPAGPTVTSSVRAEDGGSQLRIDSDLLDGWVVENGCEADVVDGCIRLKAGDGWLRSHHKYRDFDLHVEWKALQAAGYDAGIYIRSAGEGKPFPKPTYQINLLDGKEGNLAQLKGAESAGLIRKGDWNAFDIHVEGEHVALKINGQPAWSVGGLQAADGYVGFQIEVPKGGQFLLRNITVKELNYKPLCDGQDLAGWTAVGGAAADCWSVVDGCIVCNGQKGPWLRSDASFGDFNLRFDYQLSPGGNSGIYVRVPEDGNHHRENDTLPPAGVEVQVLDDFAEKHAKLKDYQYSASVYDIAGASPRVSRQPGGWNTMEINCRGQHYSIVHNGTTVVNLTEDDHPLIKLRKTEGFLGLQNHSTVVRFRNLRIGPAAEFPLPAK
jgi:hypothetical protein